MIIESRGTAKKIQWRFSLKTLLLIVAIVAVAIVLIGRQ